MPQAKSHDHIAAGKQRHLLYGRAANRSWAELADFIGSTLGCTRMRYGWPVGVYVQIFAGARVALLCRAKLKGQARSRGACAMFTRTPGQASMARTVSNQEYRAKYAKPARSDS